MNCVFGRDRNFRQLRYVSGPTAQPQKLDYEVHGVLYPYLYKKRDVLCGYRKIASPSAVKRLVAISRTLVQAVCLKAYLKSKRT